MFFEKVMEMYQKRINSGQHHQQAIKFNMITDFKGMSKLELDNGVNELISYGYATRQVREFTLTDAFFG